MITHYQTFEELTDTATAYMASLRYNLKMIDYYQREWRYVGSYMKKKGIKEYTPAVGTQYLFDVVGEVETKDLPKSKRMRIRTISCLSDFLMGGAFRRRKRNVSPEELTGEIGLAIAQYIITLSRINGYAKSTIQSYRLYLSRFLKYLNECNIHSFDSFRPEVMVNFAGSLSEYTTVTRHFIILKTNQFLKYQTHVMVRNTLWA